jgi:hypothetical protein
MFQDEVERLLTTEWCRSLDGARLDGTLALNYSSSGALLGIVLVLLRSSTTSMTIKETLLNGIVARCSGRMSCTELLIEKLGRVELLADGSDEMM